MQRTAILFLIAVCAVCFVPVSGARTIVVKQDGTGDATAIQAALMAASDGDIIEIGDDGRYVEDLTASPVLAQAGLPAAPLVSFTLRAAEGKHPSVEAENAEASQRMIVVGVPGRDMLGCVIWGCKGVTIQGIEFINFENTMNAFNVESTLVIADCADVTIENCTIRGPGVQAPGEGAGMLIAGVQAQPFLTDNITVRNCLVTETHYGIISAVFQKGSGADPNQVTIEDCTFLTGFEAGIFIGNARQATVRRCSIDDYLYGIHLAGGNSTVEDCIVLRSKSEGLRTDVDETWADEITGGVLRRCAFIDNGVESPEGGVRCVDGPLRFENCIIAGNGGPGIRVSTGSSIDVSVVIDRCDVYENAGDYEVVVEEDGMSFAQLTITNTNIVSSGGGINNQIELEAVTAHHNNVFVGVDPYIEVTYTDSVSVDPMYVSPTVSGTEFTFEAFQLKPGSPVLSVGEGGSAIGSQGAQATAVETWPVQ